jgi:membrane protease YdiL (CAAX protease family)
MLLKSLKDYRENYKKYLSHVVIAVPITMILIVIVAITLSSFGIGDSSNETAVNEALKVNPLIQGVTVIFIGPFVEEMIFRGFLYEKVRSLIGNDKRLIIWLWVFVVSVLFMLNHCDLEDFQSLKLMASYLIVFVEGLVMTGLYEKDRNIFSSLLLHCCINAIASLN